MIEQGLVDEVRGLLAQGVDPSSLSMQGLGYKEIVSYLEGRATLNEAIDVLKKRTPATLPNGSYRGSAG